MFTGIIEAKGKILEIKTAINLVRLSVHAPDIFKGTKLGDSIAVNGVCLTVTRLVKPGKMIFELMQETILSTTLKNLRPGAVVNLERAMKKDGRFGGHFVTGHVDGMGTIEKIVNRPNYVEFRIVCERTLRRFLVPKGSVCIDGVSLTVGTVNPRGFSVYLIPYTLKVTSLGLKKDSDQVNIETDLLAKYVLTQYKKA